MSHCCSQNSYDKLLAEVPKYKMITPSVLSDRLRVRHCCSEFWTRNYAFTLS